MRWHALIFISLLISSAKCQTFNGAWYGTLDAMGQQLPLVIHLSDSNAVWTGSLDSPKQKAYRIPMSTISIKDLSISFNLSAIQASFEGLLTDSMVIVGTFKQGPFKAPLHFSKNSKETVAISKIQEPKAPFPYVEEEVTIRQVINDFNISGSITHPAEQQKIPCLILITGSGPQDRNEEILGHKPFLILADQLTRAGYAVLRMDDRGIGKSGGEFAEATTEDFSHDIEAALQFVKSVSYVDTQKIFLVGHSEGGMIANMVAARHPEVFGVVSLAGPGIVGSTLLTEQQCLIAKANGANKKALKEIRNFTTSFYPLLGFDSLSVVREKAKAFLSDYAKSIKKKEMRKSGVPDRETWIKMNLDAYVNSWMLYFLNYNPKEDLQKIQCHYLALNGTSDLQVPADMNLNAISAFCNPPKEKVKEIKALEGLNHLFQPSKTGNPTEYGSIEITFDPSAIQSIISFLNKTTH